MKPLIAQLVAALGLASARFDTDDSALDACLAEVRSRRDAAGTAEATHRAALDAMTAQRDAEKSRADAAEAKVRGLEQAEAARVDAAERADLDQLATELGVDPKLHADSAGLRKAIAKAHLGSTFREDGSADYIRAAVDIARSNKGQRDDGRTEGRAAWSPLPTPSPQPGSGGSPNRLPPAAPPPGRADSRPRSVFALSRQRVDSARAEMARNGGE